MKISAKRTLDRLFPSLAVRYRRHRDERLTAALPRIPTVHDLQLNADQRALSALVGSPELSAMEGLLSACDTFVDVGANIGFYSCIAARLGKYVVAVEPQPLNVQVLLRNLRQNELAPRFEVHATALSDDQGVAEFFGGQQGGSLIEGWSGIRANYINLVFVNTLDRLLGGRFEGERLLIKIDVEGNEQALLLGAAGTLGRLPKPDWVLEIGLTENFGGKVNPHYLETFELFWRDGYTASPFTSPERVLSRADVESWIAKRRADHDEINYLFRASASTTVL
ncbi:MAG: FkbM family methyltransferase [Terriglobia bacterium]|nr:FkbM family methyltransferase [Terriglobia bacterium]